MLIIRVTGVGPRTMVITYLPLVKHPSRVGLL